MKELLNTLTRVWQCRMGLLGSEQSQTSRCSVSLTLNRADVLDPVLFRIGLMAVIRSKAKNGGRYLLSTPCAQPEPSHHRSHDYSQS